MNTAPVPARQTTTRLQGRGLMVVRFGGITLIALTLIAFFSLLPAYISYLHAMCAGGNCSLGGSGTIAHSSTGFSVDAYSIYTLVFTFISLLMCLSVAIIILWRKSDDWMALLAALMLVLMATGFVAYLLMQSSSPWQVPALFLNIFAFTGLLLVFSLFPNGRFVPFWIGWLPIAWFCWGMFVLFRHADPVIARIHNLVWVCALLGVLLAQIYRYRRASTPVQRQQTKWVLWGGSTAILIIMLVDLPPVFIPGLMQENLFYQLLNAPADTVALFLGSFSVGMAVLRFRLWEIDSLINRTIVYGALTALLVLCYIGLIIILQIITRLLTGQTTQPPAIFVLATLVTVALFQPLRNRLQKVIDRRFYRRVYNANQALEAFGITLYSNLNLDQICEHVVAVVEETMEPVHVSLWLLQSSGTEKRTTHLLPVITASRLEE